MVTAWAFWEPMEDMNSRGTGNTGRENDMTMRARKWIPTIAAGTVAFTMTSLDGFAFFPPVPLGSTQPVTITQPPVADPVLVPPSIRPPVLIQPLDPIATVPPVPPPPFVPPPIVVQPQVVTHSCPVINPQVVPEPTTIVSGLIGMTMIGGMAWKRRRNAAGK